MTTGWITIKRDNRHIKGIRTKNISETHQLKESFDLQYGSDFDSDSLDVENPNLISNNVNDPLKDPTEITVKIPNNVSNITIQFPQLTKENNIASIDPHKKWRGLDRGDGKCRLYKSISKYYPGKIRSMYRKGRLINSFSKDKLLRIAWKIGVSNPDGFGKEDCEFLGIDNEKDGFKFFLIGWNNTSKETIGNYIWNQLYDTNEIII